ncbi:MAG: hypothetical protein CL581_14095 [Alteromonadaceae bacterium]|nr:hypothetical protein [Alteromonadaceae bacterium]
MHNTERGYLPHTAKDDLIDGLSREMVHASEHHGSIFHEELFRTLLMMVENGEMAFRTMKALVRNLPEYLGDA